MKILKITMVCILLLVSCVTLAVCPNQETTVVFMNGVWTTKTDALKHTVALGEEIYAAGADRDCVHFALSHTQDDPFITDIVEAIIQKSKEPGGLGVSSYTRMLFFYTAVNPQFMLLVTAPFIQMANEVIDVQLAKHLQTFRMATHSDAPAVRLRQRGVMVTHSQGGLYGNAVWNLLTPDEKENARMVAVATPSGYVADNGPHTRLSRDGVANLFFANALAADIPNTGLCENETEEKYNSWECHGFQTGYLHDVNAREQIVSDILNALPVVSHDSIMQGHVLSGNSPLPFAKVRLLTSTFGFIDETTTDENGFYRFASVPPGADYYAYLQFSGQFMWLGGIDIPPNETVTEDLYFVVMVSPPRPR